MLADRRYVALLSLLLPLGWFVATWVTTSNTALVLPLVIAAGIGVIFVGYEAMLLREWALLTLLSFSIVFLSILFRRREVGEAGFDPQVAMKVVVWAAMLTISAVNLRRITWLFADRAMLAWGTFSVISVISAVYSSVPVLSFVSGLSVVAYLGMACVLVSETSPRKLALAHVWAMGVYVAANVISAVVAPDLAFGHDQYVVDALHQAPPPQEWRLQGISGHPNSLGRQAALFVCLTFLAYYRGDLSKKLYTSLMILGFGACLAAQSRASFLSLIIAFAALKRRYVLPLIFGAVFVLVTIRMMGLDDTLLGLIGREGSAEDAESMAGRTDLWDYTWEQISQHPFIGYGYNSFEANAISQWYGMEFQAVSSHNNFLEALYSTGLFGFIPFMTGTGILLYRYFTDPYPPRDLLVVNVVINSLAEVDILSIAIVPTMVTFFVIALDARRRLRPETM